MPGGCDSGRPEKRADSCATRWIALSANNNDCDDAEGTIHPTGAEACDTIDSDCDLSLVDSFTDTDADSLPDCIDDNDDGDPAEDSTDCDPLDPSVYPAAPEACDTFDSDCDGSLVDESSDGDNDGIPDCVDQDLDDDGYQAVVDCDDGDPAIYPGATEVIDDGVDDDCDGADTVTCYDDLDGDGFGGSSTHTDPDGSCIGAGQSPNPDDCDDGAAAVYPGALETPDDGVDGDCSGDDSAVCNVDGDEDGAGSSITLVSEDSDCTDLGEASDSVDCDDADPGANPGIGTEDGVSCSDGADNDCDGAVDLLDGDCASGDDDSGDDDSGDDDSTPGDDDVTGDDDTTSEPTPPITPTGGPGCPVDCGAAGSGAFLPVVGLGGALGLLRRRRRSGVAFLGTILCLGVASAEEPSATIPLPETASDVARRAHDVFEDHCAEVQGGQLGTAQDEARTLPDPISTARG